MRIIDNPPVNADDDIQSEIDNTLAGINRLNLVRQCFPKLKEAVGIRLIQVSYFRKGAIHWAAGLEQAHVPTLLDIFGREDWTLHQQCGLHYLQKVLPMGVEIIIDYVDPLSPLLPDCHIIPTVEHSKN